MMSGMLHKSIYERYETSNIKDIKNIKKVEFFKTFYLIVALIEKPSFSKG